jgi:hypothetical protein
MPYLTEVVQLLETMSDNVLRGIRNDGGNQKRVSHPPYEPIDANPLVCSKKLEPVRINYYPEGTKRDGRGRGTS